ncbi:TPA: aci13, variant 2 [Trebouxia sp. C0005]
MFECRRSIAKNYSHIKNVEAQLAQLQSQLNLTTGPKKSALEMLRKKIEAKNEQVVAARQKFVLAQKVAEQAQEVLTSHERSKEQLCQELHLLVHQSATAELNKLEQLTKQLEQLNRGSLTESSGAEAAAREQALAQGVVLSKDTPSAEEAAAATIQQQALAAADAAHQVRPASSPAPTLTHAPTTHDAASQHCQSQTLRGVQAQPPSQGQQARPSQAVPAKQAAQHAQQIGRKKSHQNRRQLVPLADKAVSPQVASDSAGRFTGFES